MKLRFVCGGSGSGKSHEVYGYVVTESIAHPEKNYFVIVPEQFTMQTQKELCTVHPRGGIMNIDVLSFGRLAYRISEEVGQDSRVLLDDEGKSLVLRRIAGQCEETLTVLKGNLKKQGYISEVKSVISEFMQYGVDDETLDEMISGLEPESYLSYKLQDIRKVYEEFEAFLKEKYVTKEEMLDILSDIVPDSELLRGSTIVLDGFTGFTPVQVRLLRELFCVCEEVIVTVEIDERQDPFRYDHPYQLFALSKQMVRSLADVAQETGAEVEMTRLPGYPVRRFADNPAMAFLENALFRYSKQTWEKEQNAVSLHEVRAPRAEAAYVAESIRRLVREEGYRYREIAIIAADMNVYADAIEKACAEFDIPVFMDYKKSILQNSFVEYLRSLLGMAEQGYTYESVFRHLRSGMSGFAADETDRLENYVIALGIKGYKRWQQMWVRQTREAEEEELRELNALRERFVEKTDALAGVLRRRRKTVRDITLAVYKHLVQEGIQEQIAGLEKHFREEGQLALAKEYAQVYRIVMELFDKFAGLLGEETVSLKEYCELLDAGLEEAKVGVIPPSLDQVVAGDVQRTRIRDIRALFFVGANDTLLPGRAGAGGLLSERDREQFRERKIALSPGSKEELYIQKFYLYLNLTKPTEYLSISWSKVSADGKTLRPAYLVQDVRRMFPGITVEDEDSRDMTQREMTRPTGLIRLAEGLRGRGGKAGRDWKELYTWYVRNASDDEAVNQMLNAAFLTKNREQLSPETASALYPKPERISVTRLEQFAACAYAHFLKYGLRLSDREEYGFEAMDLGNIAHRALERFAGKAQEEQLEWSEIPPEKAREMIDTCVEESILDYGNTVLYSTARNEYMIGRIKRLLQRSVWALAQQIAAGDFKPRQFEMTFGSGKIDRVDTCEDEGTVYVKVTDYKTGMKVFDITALYYGLQLQLPVYLNAAAAVEEKRHPDKKIVPAAMFYYKIQDPIVEKEETDEKIERSILKKLRQDGLVSGDEKVLSHLERDLREKSLYYPVEYKKDGTLTKASGVLMPERFDEMLRFAKAKEQELKQSMYSGEVRAEPYEYGDETGCDYCPCRDICGFDLKIEGCRYRTMSKIPGEEAERRIREYLEEWIETDE